MEKKLKVVLDTNVFISSFLRSPSCLKIFELLSHRVFTIVLSDPIISEIKNVLGSKEFGTVTATNIKMLFDAVSVNCEIVSPANSVSASRDPDDNKFLEAAVAGKADIIVTGDRDLLVLNPFLGITIVRPKEFIRIVDAR